MKIPVEYAAVSMTVARNAFYDVKILHRTSPGDLLHVVQENQAWIDSKIAEASGPLANHFLSLAQGDLQLGGFGARLRYKRNIDNANHAVDHWIGGVNDTLSLTLKNWIAHGYARDYLAPKRILFAEASYEIGSIHWSAQAAIEDWQRAVATVLFLGVDRDYQ